MSLLVLLATASLISIQLKLKNPLMEIDLKKAHIAMSVAAWLGVIGWVGLIVRRKWMSVLLTSPFLVLLRSSRPFVKAPPSTSGTFLLIYTFALVGILQVLDTVFIR